MSSEANNLLPGQTSTPPVVLTPDQQRQWNNFSPPQRRLFSSLIAAGVTIGAVLLLIWLIERKVKNVLANREENKSFGNDKHSTWAKQFMQAFDNDAWWGMGTDEALIRQTIRAIPSKEDFNKVATKYKTMTKGGNLVADLTNELSSTEYEEMLAILNSKPAKAKDAKPGQRIYDTEGWARRIHAAVNYHYWIGTPGTDEKAIRMVFQEFPSKQAFYNTAAAYKRLYGISIWTDLDNDLDWSLDWRALLKNKPKYDKYGK
jgi:hypothetical protein